MVILHLFTFSCLQQLEKEFLGYLKEWKASVASWEGFTPTEKARMCLSRETLEGLHIYRYAHYTVETGIHYVTPWLHILQ